MTSLAVLSAEQEVQRAVIAEAPKEIKGLDIHRVSSQIQLSPISRHGAKHL